MFVSKAPDLVYDPQTKTSQNVGGTLQSQETASFGLSCACKHTDRMKVSNVAQWKKAAHQAC